MALWESHLCCCELGAAHNHKSPCLQALPWKASVVAHCEAGVSLAHAADTWGGENEERGRDSEGVVGSVALTARDALWIHPSYI